MLLQLAVFGSEGFEAGSASAVCYFLRQVDAGFKACAVLDKLGSLVSFVRQVLFVWYKQVV